MFKNEDGSSSVSRAVELLREKMSGGKTENGVLPEPQQAAPEMPAVKATASEGQEIQYKETGDKHVTLETLPSDFHPYPFKELKIRPFGVTELKMVARAIEYKSNDYIRQAVDACINVPVDILTIPDYHFLWYWLRIESYPSTPYYMPWECDEPVKGEDGQVSEHAVCGHDNMSPLQRTSIETIHLKDVGFDPSNFDHRLDFPRVSLLSDLEEAEASRKKLQEQKELGAEELSYADLMLVNAAKWVKEGKTIREKIAVLEAQGDLNLYEAALKVAKQLHYGVFEFAFVTCGRCGAKRRYRVSLDAPSFFP